MTVAGWQAAPGEVTSAALDLLLRCGADAQRVFDGERWPLERFASLVSRIYALRAATIAPLVLLTRTNPVALTIVQTRRVLEEAIPRLSSAIWIIFFDPLTDPFFLANSLDSEDVGAALGDAPIWTSPRAGTFLILSDQISQRELVARRVAALEVESLLESGVRAIERLGLGDGARAHEK